MYACVVKIEDLVRQETRVLVEEVPHDDAEDARREALRRHVGKFGHVTVSTTIRCPPPRRAETLQRRRAA